MSFIFRQLSSPPGPPGLKNDPPQATEGGGDGGQKMTAAEWKALQHKEEEAKMTLDEWRQFEAQKATTPPNGTWFNLVGTESFDSLNPDELQKMVLDQGFFVPNETTRGVAGATAKAATATTSAIKGDDDDDEDAEWVPDPNALAAVQKAGEFDPILCEPARVPPNPKAPKSGSSTKQFLDVSGFEPGSTNVVLNGPWVNFWCADCGRRLAPRSIHDHWMKSHGGDRLNMAGLQNVAIHAMKRQVFAAQTAGASSTKRPVHFDNVASQKKPKTNPIGANYPNLNGWLSGVLFSKRTAAHKKNPFFIMVDAMPNKATLSKADWLHALNNCSLSSTQYKQGYNAIESQFAHVIN